MKTGIIYISTCLITNKSYIGQTIRTLEQRKSKHKSDCKRSTRSAFHKAILKYGFENFTWDILYSANEEDLDRLEILSIYRYQTLSPNGYNLKIGGSQGQHSERTKQKISRANRGKTAWNRGKKGGTSWNKGRKLTKEHREKLSEAKKGRKLSAETRQKMSDAHKGRKYTLGKKLTEEHKQKIGKSQIGNKHSLGRKLTKEHRQKLSEANKGNKHTLGLKHTEEAKRKIGLAAKGRIPWNKGKKLKKTGQLSLFEDNHE